MKKSRSCLLSLFLTAFAAMFLIAASFAQTDVDKKKHSPHGPPEKVVICHNGQTLTLPKPAAERHLQQHPNDTLGPCPSPTPKPKPTPKGPK
jgi:hypothetical protein